MSLRYLCDKLQNLDVDENILDIDFKNVQIFISGDYNYNIIMGKKNNIEITYLSNIMLFNGFINKMHYFIYIKLINNIFEVDNLEIFNEMCKKLNIML